MNLLLWLLLLWLLLSVPAALLFWATCRVGSWADES